MTELKVRATIGSAPRLAGELRVMVSRLRRQMLELSLTDDLSPSELSVLSRLDMNGPQSVTALAAAERMRPQSLGTKLDVLVDKGFVDRLPHPNDGRSRIVVLTDAGREWLTGGRQVRQEWLSALIAERYTEDERQTLMQAMALLHRLDA